MPVAPQLVRVVAAEPGGVRLEPVAEATVGCCRLAGEEVFGERAQFVAREQPVPQGETDECRQGRDDTARRRKEMGVTADGLFDLGHEVGEGEGLRPGKIKYHIA